LWTPFQVLCLRVAGNRRAILSQGQGWYRSAKAQNSTKAPLTGNPNQQGPHMLRDRAPPAPHLPHQHAPVLEQDRAQLHARPVPAVPGTRARQQRITLLGDRPTCSTSGVAVRIRNFHFRIHIRKSFPREQKQFDRILLAGPRCRVPTPVERYDCCLRGTFCSVFFREIHTRILPYALGFRFAAATRLMRTARRHDH
jgi:hypothetical protein